MTLPSHLSLTFTVEAGLSEPRGQRTNGGLGLHKGCCHGKLEPDLILFGRSRWRLEPHAWFLGMGGGSVRVLGWTGY